MNTRLTSVIAASALLATGGVFYYKNLRRIAPAGVSATTTRPDLRDAPNNENNPGKNNPAHSKLKLLSDESGDAQGKEIGHAIGSLSDVGLENLARLEESIFGVPSAFRIAYPESEPITKTEIITDSPSYNSVGSVRFKGPMSLNAFVAGGESAALRLNSADAANTLKIVEAAKALKGNYQFYTVHFVNEEDGDHLDGVIIDKATNQLLAFTF